jgi:uncharacterized delta-60 repeat protein
MSFGTGGGVYREQLGGANNDVATSVVIQPDGKIVVGGHTDSGVNGINFQVLRLLENGTRDLDFAATQLIKGRYVLDFGTNDDQISDVALASDGSIVVAGQSGVGSSRGVALARFTGAGVLDTGFNGGQGRLTHQFSSVDADHAGRVFIQPDGRIVVAGAVDEIAGGNNYDALIARFTASGQLDTTFGAQGQLKLHLYDNTQPAAGDIIRDLVARPDGSFVVVVDTETISTTQFQTTVLSFTPSGLRDTSFAPEGRLNLTTVGLTRSQAIALSPAGELIVAGAQAISAGNEDFGVLRLSTGDANVLAPLGRLTSLTHLDVSHNQITDIRPLAGLEALQWLDLEHNRVRSIETLLGQTIIDDIEPGYRETGPIWSGGAHPSAFDDDYRYTPAGDSTSTAAFEFEGLAAGQYKVFVTWPEHATRTAEAIYAIDGGALRLDPIGDFTLFQDLAPPAEPIAPTGVTRSVVINTDTYQILVDGSPAPDYFGFGTRVAIINGVVTFLVPGDVLIGPDHIRITGWRPLSLVAGDDVFVSPDAVIDASAVGPLGGPGGANAVTVAGAPGTINPFGGAGQLWGGWGGDGGYYSDCGGGSYNPNPATGYWARACDRGDNGELGMDGSPGAAGSSGTGGASGYSAFNNTAIGLGGAAGVYGAEGSRGLHSTNGGAGGAGGSTSTQDFRGIIFVPRGTYHGAWGGEAGGRGGDGGAGGGGHH